MTASVSPSEPAMTGVPDPFPSTRSSSPWRRRLLLGAVVLVAIGAGIYVVPSALKPAGGAASAAAPGSPPPVPVAVATVEARDTRLYESFSGRLEAVERVEVRSRVAGAIKAVHFREGALVKAGDLLVTIDPEPYQAALDEADAQVASAEAQLELARNELERGERLFTSRTLSQRDLDERLNTQRAAQAALRAAEARRTVARLNLSYTQVRAPVAGRVGKSEITVGNLIAAGPGAQLLTSLVSVDPIYASFNADEATVAQALAALGTGADVTERLDRIPVRMTAGGNAPVTGVMQLVDNQVDPRTGTVRVRARFANPDGHLLPGQFARLEMGQPQSAPTVLVSERAVGTDQDKKFVFVVDADNKAVWREVTLGAPVDGLRVVTRGLSAGERVVVNGLHRVRPGAAVTPETAPMQVTEATSRSAAAN